jgi:hypothetical protein
VCRDWKEEFCGGAYLHEDDEDDHDGGSSNTFTQTSLLEISKRAEVDDWVRKSLGLNHSFGSPFQHMTEALSKRAKSGDGVHISQLHAEANADATSLIELDSLVELDASVKGKCTG